MTEEESLLSSQPRLVRRGSDVYSAVAEARAKGETIGLVPTMGALHDGHLSLVRAARAQCSLTVVTIFVNPTQFGPHEDLDKYPRTLEADLESLANYDVNLVFVPDDAEMYPAGFSTYVQPPDVALPLEGRCRPGHFRGVTTVVLKLFHFIPADFAFFGQKDYQQSLVIRQMVRDLNLPIEIRVCPIIREPDGLALSSRNAYLSADQRRQALALSRSLELANNLVQQGEGNASVVRERMRQLLVDAGISRIDYVAIANADTLQDVSRIGGPTMALVAAYVGQTRLIDNRRIG